MYKFVSIGGTSLSRIEETFSDLIVIKEANSIEEFIKLLDDGYRVIVNGLTDGGISTDYDLYIEHINKNNIPILVDCLYESNIMDFHYRDIFKTRKGLIFSNLINSHPKFDYTINVPYFFLQTHILLKKFNLSPITFDEHLSSTKNSFVCLNAVSRSSRKYAYDFFRERKAYPDIFSFVNRESNKTLLEQYPTILLDDDVDNPNDGVQWDNTYKRNWFLNTHFNLVTESSAENESSQGPKPLHAFDNCFFPTEKTFKPIYNCHPFICIADKDYHQNLKKYFGFDLYEEIWDYSFDSIENNKDRWHEVLKQSIQVGKDGIDYNKIKEKLISNQQKFLDIENHENILLDVLKQIDKFYF